MTDQLNRRVAVAFSLAAEGTVRIFFGPFAMGERVKGFYLYGELGGTGAAIRHEIEVRAFASIPPDTTADFAGNGRPLTNAQGGTKPFFTLISDNCLGFFFPMGWEGRPDNKESYLGLELTSPAGAAVGADGSVWIELDPWV